MHNTLYPNLVDLSIRVVCLEIHMYVQVTLFNHEQLSLSLDLSNQYIIIGYIFCMFELGVVILEVRMLNSA